MVNTRAGRQRPRENGERVRRVFALGGAHTRTAYTASLEEADSFLERAAAAGPDLLVICGGDGTLSHSVNVLARLGADLPLGYVPMGTRSLAEPRSKSCGERAAGWTWVVWEGRGFCMWPPLGPLPSPPTRRRPR